MRLRFYEELNDFLPPELRKTELQRELNRRSSVKDVIESFGVPHTEVDVILVNGMSVGFDHPVEDDDRISVYPVFESLDVGSVVRLKDRPLRNPRFVLDCNLGRLARYLRLLGFNALYRNDYADAEIAAISSEQQRIVLTRDRALLQRKIITRGYFVRSDKPRTQVKEVMERLDLYRLAAPFHRCMKCNGLLEEVDKASVEKRLEPLTRKHYRRFRRCVECGQIYWQGSHHTRAERLVAEFLRAGP